FLLVQLAAKYKGSGMPQCKAPWMLAAKELRSDLPFFGSFGLIAGLVQWVAYHYFDKSNVGAKLLQEHIAFRSLVLTVIFLWGAKGLLARLSVTEERPRLSAFVEHVAGRAVAFASVAAAVIAGCAFAALLLGAFGVAIRVLFFAIYFVALAEIAANPFLRSGQSRTVWLAMGVVVSML